MADHSHAVDASVYHNAQGAITLTLHGSDQFDMHLVMTSREAVGLAAMLQLAASDMGGNSNPTTGRGPGAGGPQKKH